METAVFKRSTHVLTLKKFLNRDALFALYVQTKQVDKVAVIELADRQCFILTDTTAAPSQYDTYIFLDHDEVAAVVTGSNRTDVEATALRLATELVLAG